MRMSLYAPNLPACEISLTMDNVIVGSLFRLTAQLSIGPTN
jgi:hypothetical protein